MNKKKKLLPSDRRLESSVGSWWRVSSVEREARTKVDTNFPGTITAITAENTSELLRNILWNYYGNTGELLHNHCGITVQIPHSYCRITVEIQRNYCGNTVEIQRNYCGNTTENTAPDLDIIT